MTDELIELEEEEYTSNLTMPVLRRIGGLLKPHWRWVLGFLVTIALVSSMDAYFTYLNKQIVDQGIKFSDYERVSEIAWMYGSFLILQAAFIFIFIYLAGVLGERVQYDLRKMLFNHLQDLSLSYYAQNAVGRLIARVTSDTGRVSDLVTWGIVDSVWAVMNITTSLTFMAIINWRLALIVSVIIPIMMFVATKFQKYILVEFRQSRRANSKITGAYNENIQGVRVVKALGREDENLVEFQQLTTRMYRASYRAAWLSALFLPTVQIIAALALGAIVWYGPHCADHRCVGAGCHCLVRWSPNSSRAHHHRWYSGFRFVSHFHDVACTGPGARVCRNAAQHCLSGENFQISGYPARGP